MKAILAFAAALFALTSQTGAQSTPDGVFIGAEENSDGSYKATVQLKIGEATNDILPTYPFTGKMVFSQILQSAPPARLAGRMGGDIVNGGDRGRFRHSFSGTVRTGTFRLGYESRQDRMLLALRAEKLGQWEGILLTRRVSPSELVGRWAFPDGNVMTITKQEALYYGNYRGTAASGHPDLTGTLGGRLRKDTWSGSFQVTENNFQASDVFSFRYFNESPPALKGTIGGNSYVLAKQQ